MEEFKNDADFEENETLDLRVLFVDDNESMRRYIGGLLRSRYTHVEVVEDGQQALDLFKTPGKRFEIVITDKSMPNKSGIDVLREIHSMEGLENFPVIVVTNENLPEVKAAVEALGGVFITKPFKGEDLLNKIEELTRKA